MGNKGEQTLGRWNLPSCKQHLGLGLPTWKSACLQAFMSCVARSLHWLSSMYSLQMIFSELLGSGKQLEGLQNGLCTFLAQMSNALKFNTDRTEWLSIGLSTQSSQVLLLSYFTTSHSDVGDLLSFLWNRIDHAIKWSLNVCQKSNLNEAPAA